MNYMKVFDEFNSKIIYNKILLDYINLKNVLFRYMQYKLYRDRIYKEEDFKNGMIRNLNLLKYNSIIDDSDYDDKIINKYCILSNINTITNYAMKTHYTLFKLNTTCPNIKLEDYIDEI